ncbi:hypothetical protein AB0C50_22090 [Micromonospora taraxaci]|uniref:hypothetical protein n=1 Tax=Micromonospora taraxaci TaxID=1316803 RepID=UPI00340EFD3F
MRVASLEPLEEYRGIKFPWRCRCTGCGKETAPTYGGILAGQGGCRRCADLATADRNRESPAAAAASMRAAGFEPLEAYTNSVTGWMSQHTACGRTSRPKLSKIRAGGGCRYCAQHGFRRADPARIYVASSTKLGAVKIGVAGAAATNDRTNYHRRHGFDHHEQRLVDTGDLALSIEQTVLQTLRAEGHEAFLSVEQLPNGWTETFDSSAVPANRLLALVDAAVATLDS